jgi:hypothetical protein
MPSQTTLPSNVKLWKATKQYLDKIHLWRAFWLGPANDKSRHLHLWNMFFQHNHWLKLVVEKHKLNPIIASKDLDDIYEGVTKVQGNYAVLFIANIGKGNVQDIDHKLFFSSLSLHVYNSMTKEVTFQSGVTLNVRNIIDSSGSINVPTQLFFQVPKLQTWYSCYTDPHYALQKCTKRFLRANPLLPPDDPHFHCEVLLRDSTGREMSIPFRNNYRIGEIQLSSVTSQP